MTTQTEALKLALEALERIDLWLKARYSGIGLVGVELDAITAIKEALAQLEHEKERCVGCEACIDTACGRDECPKGWPKAAQPAVAEQHKQEPVPAAMKTVIEAMQQDPDYAWGWHCNIAMSFVDAGGDHYTGNQGAARFMRTLANVEPAHELPFSPPQRTWVGLTPEETLDWLAQQHFDQCREERPIQDWIRKMKSQLPKEKNT